MSRVRRRVASARTLNASGCRRVGGEDGRGFVVLAVHVLACHAAGRRRPWPARSSCTKRKGMDRARSRLPGRPAQPLGQACRHSPAAYTSNGRTPLAAVEHGVAHGVVQQRSGASDAGGQDRIQRLSPRARCSARSDSRTMPAMTGSAVGRPGPCSVHRNAAPLRTGGWAIIRVPLAEAKRRIHAGE